MPETAEDISSEAWADMDDQAKKALYIRCFELELLELFNQGLLAGTLHTCVGQEWPAAALHPHLIPGIDAFFATHRGHGHYLAHGGPAADFLAELMGREGALCLGRGGTQNLFFERFFSAGIQGGAAPIAVGFAWAARELGQEAVAVAQIGDGTLGEGALYEGFNFAGWLKAPVLFLLEANGWAQSTDVSRTTPGDLLRRAEGFGLEVGRISDDNPQALSEHFCRVVARVRDGRPHLIVVDTRRLMAHSKGDDDRSPQLIAKLHREDPLTRLLERSEAAREYFGHAAAEVRALGVQVAGRPKLKYELRDALPRARAAAGILSSGLHSDLDGPARGYRRVAEELNDALHAMMAERPDVVLIGEDLLDPYGGAFKVSKGLSTAYPARVLSTPIAEAAITGAANGMALAGLRPVAEIMFADFATLAADQLINFAAKFHYMYGERIAAPLTLRLVSGGGRGYGPTHSQSTETLFCGVPGIRVVALSQRHRPAELLRHSVLEDDGPVVFVENKLLYALRPHAEPPVDLRPAPVEAAAPGDLPPLCYVPAGRQRAGVTLVTYGGMTGAAEAAMRELIEQEELAFDYVVLTQLWPLNVDWIADSVRRTRRLVVIEENTAGYGISAAVLAAVSERVADGFAARRVGADAVPLPSARHLEALALPSASDVCAAIRDIS
jgi:2-oxoisovalerate dehydrogenase E1 component